MEVSTNIDHVCRIVSDRLFKLAGVEAVAVARNDVRRAVTCPGVHTDHDHSLKVLCHTALIAYQSFPSPRQENLVLLWRGRRTTVYECGDLQVAVVVPIGHPACKSLNRTVQRSVRRMPAEVPA